MSDDLRAELETLHRDLRRVASAAVDEARAKASDVSDNIVSEIERVLTELKDQLGDAEDKAESLIAENPFVATASAFLLGVAVGRWMGRAR